MWPRLQWPVSRPLAMVLLMPIGGASLVTVHGADLTLRGKCHYWGYCHEIIRHIWPIHTVCAQSAGYWFQTEPSLIQQITQSSSLESAVRFEPKYLSWKCRDCLRIDQHFVFTRDCNIWYNNPHETWYLVLVFKSCLVTALRPLHWNMDDSKL